MSSDNIYITTPIFYVNDVPYIGHAYTSIAWDVIARFMRLAGRDEKYLTGTDEHGQKVEESAEKANIAPQEFADKTSASFYKMMSILNISNDEAYYAESELTKDGMAPTGAPVEWVEEPSYFFALSKWQDKLLEYYEHNSEFIWPKSRRDEVISFVKKCLIDLSISRTSFKWGVPVPGNPEHVIYVWLDALTKYIKALGYPDDKPDFAKFWPASAHVVGKDILHFHAVYWPAFLIAAGLKWPKSIVVHGWWTNEGEKISKSVGNVINPFDLVEEFCLDQVHYFLMREINFGSDGNFSRENLVLRNNSKLANKICNLVQRTSAFVYKYCERKIPNIESLDINEVYESPLFKEIETIIKSNMMQMQRFNINKVIDNIIHITELANFYIDQEAPWALRKTDTVKMQQVVYVLLETLRYIGIMLQPFKPDAAIDMLDQLNIPEDQHQFINMNKEYALKPGATIRKPKPIFPRLDQ